MAFDFFFCSASLCSEATRENNMVISAIDLAYDQGRRQEFLTGERIPTGRTDEVEPKTPTPKFRFLLGFCPLHFENIGKSKKRQIFWNFSFNIVISGATPPEY